MVTGGWVGQPGMTQPGPLEGLLNCTRGNQEFRNDPELDFMARIG